MNENLTPQIVTALLQDGTVKMTGEEIAAAIADAIGALDKPYRFRGVATPGLAPGKIFEPTLYVAVASATYGPFSNQSVDKGQIVFFTSDDGAFWSDVVAYCGGDGCPEPPGPGPEPDPSAQPLTFRALESGTQVSFLIDKVAQDAHDLEQFAKTIEISTDGGQTWTEKTASIAGTLLATLQAGEELQVRGNNAAYANPIDIDTGHYHKFAATKSCEVFGNIMSLIDAENYEEKQLAAYNSYAFYGLFTDATWLHNADDAPLLLPSKNLAEGCYSGMFFGCTSLTAAPALPATTLAVSCYSGMFLGCTSLTAAPALPATTLVELCYESMFGDCAALAAVECLATDLSAAALNALDDWLLHVAATGTFTKAAGVAWPSGGSGIPNGWTVVEG